MSNRNIIDKIYLINTGSIIDNIINNNQTVQETKDDVININNNLTYINETIGIINNEIENINTLDEEQNNRLDNIIDNINTINNNINDINDDIDIINDNLDLNNMNINMINEYIETNDTNINNINNSITSINNTINNITKFIIDDGTMSFRYNAASTYTAVYYTLKSTETNKGIIFIHLPDVNLNFKYENENILVFTMPSGVEFVNPAYTDVITYRCSTSTAEYYKQSTRSVAQILDGKNEIHFYVDDETLSKKSDISNFKIYTQIIKVPVKFY